MAIIYSYPKQTSLQSTDLLVSTRFSTEPGVVSRSISFSLETLVEYIAANHTSTLNQVLTAGNTSLLDAKVGSVYLYDDNSPAGYSSIRGSKNRINFYGKNGVSFGYITQDSLFLHDDSSIYGLNISIPSSLTGNRIATFQDASGTIAYLSDIASSPQGLYAQYEDSIYVSETTSEESLIGGGMGTLSVPANTFSRGDSFQANLMGKISCVGSANLHIRVKTSGGILLVDTGIMELDTCTDKCWKLDLNFTIRSTGGAGSASIASGGLFSYVRNAGTNFEGVCFNFVNNTTFDTTIDNELEVTAQWNTTNSSNKIFSQIFTLNKIF